MVSQTNPLLTCNEDYAIDPFLNELGLYAEMQEALEAVRPVWTALANVSPWEAQYVVPLAYNVRYVLRANLRELFHIIELRSKKEGHPSYRKIAQELADEVLDDCPFLKSYLRVDRQHYDFARSA
jgi:thymidylate synthase ThyX